MRCYIFDIDGTIADLTHRLHHITSEPKNWDAFYDACELDSPIPHIIDLANQLCMDDVEVIFVSGRSERCREATMKWLRKQFKHWNWCDDRKDLYMRRDGDHRHDHFVKGELLDQILADGWRPIMAFEDRDQVVKMWRERGIPCAQVAEGNF